MSHRLVYLMIRGSSPSSPPSPYSDPPTEDSPFWLLERCPEFFSPLPTFSLEEFNPAPVDLSSPLTTERARLHALALDLFGMNIPDLDSAELTCEPPAADTRASACSSSAEPIATTAMSGISAEVETPSAALLPGEPLPVPAEAASSPSLEERILRQLYPYNVVSVREILSQVSQENLIQGSWSKRQVRQQLDSMTQRGLCQMVRRIKSSICWKLTPSYRRLWLANQSRFAPCHGLCHSSLPSQEAMTGDMESSAPEASSSQQAEWTPLMKQIDELLRTEGAHTVQELTEQISTPQQPLARRTILHALWGLEALHCCSCTSRDRGPLMWFPVCSSVADTSLVTTPPLEAPPQEAATETDRRVANLTPLQRSVLARLSERELLATVDVMHDQDSDRQQPQLPVGGTHSYTYIRTFQALKVLERLQLCQSQTLPGHRRTLFWSLRPSSNEPLNSGVQRPTIAVGCSTASPPLSAPSVPSRYSLTDPMRPSPFRAVDPDA